MKNNTTTTVITKHNRENKPSSRVTMIINITIVFFLSFVQTVLDDATTAWGIKVERVEM